MSVASASFNLSTVSSVSSVSPAGARFEDPRGLRTLRSPAAGSGSVSGSASVPASASTQSAADRGPNGAFEAAIRGARGGSAAAARPSQATEPEGARASAEQFVASALLLPLLAEARGGALKSDLFGGGFAHDAIAQQLETHLADAVVRGANFPVVDRIVADALRREGA